MELYTIKGLFIHNTCLVSLAKTNGYTWNTANPKAGQ